MIKVLRDVQKRILGVQKEIKKEVQKTLKELEPQILDLNIEQMDEKGEDSKGKELPGPYADFTIEIKKSKQQRFDIVTLHDTGAFHKGFFIKFYADYFEISSTDDKTDMLEKEWGKSIFGLNNNNKVYISQEMKDYLIEYAKKKLHENNR